MRRSAVSSKAVFRRRPGAPVILLFTGESGHQYGYDDGPQTDGTYWYTGEGQRGDMVLKAGNKAIRDSADEGRVIHLFEQRRKAWVRYIGKATYVGHHTSTTRDVDGNERRAIVFELALGNEESAGEVPDLRLRDGPRSSRRQSAGQDLAALRRAALAVVPKDAPPSVRHAIVRERQTPCASTCLRERRACAKLAARQHLFVALTAHTISSRTTSAA